MSGPAWEDLVTELDGKPAMTFAGWDVLIGLPAETVAAEYERQKAAGQRFVMPKAWRRKIKEQQAKYNTMEKWMLLSLILIAEDEQGDST